MVGDNYKTFLKTHCGTDLYARRIFGFRNAPETFQRALDIILSGVRCKTFLVYLDDFIVISPSDEQHLKGLQ